MSCRAAQFRSRFGPLLLSARKPRENRPPQKARRTVRPCHECPAHTRLPHPRGFAEVCRNMPVGSRLKNRETLCVRRSYITERLKKCENRHGQWICKPKTKQF